MGRGDYCTELTREELYAQVWVEPMTKLAQRYGMSDRGLAKVCIRLLAAMDERHDTPCGPAVKKLCERACEVFGEAEYVRQCYVMCYK